MRCCCILIPKFLFANLNFTPLKWSGYIIMETMSALLFSSEELGPFLNEKFARFLNACFSNVYDHHASKWTSALFIFRCDHMHIVNTCCIDHKETPYTSRLWCLIKLMRILMQFSGEYWYSFGVNIVEYQCRYWVILILGEGRWKYWCILIQFLGEHHGISMQISGDTAISWILMQISMHIDVFLGWILWNINADIRWCCYQLNIDANIDADWCSFV